MYCQTIVMCLLGVFCFLPASPAWTQDVEKEKQAKATRFPPMSGPIFVSPSIVRVNEKLHAGLNQPAKLDYFEMPFADVAEDLKARFEIPIILHESAEENGLDIDTLITIQFEGCPLRIALIRLLDTFNCTYQIDGEVIWFIDKEVAYFKLETRIFDCRELLKIDGQGEQSTMKLANLIKSTVEPYSWDTKDGKGCISEFGGVFVVLQRSTHQVSIQQLLEELEKRLKESGD